MIKKIELFWNIVYYGIYHFDVYFRKMIGYLNPFKIIDSIETLRAFRSKNEINNMRSFRNQIFNDKKTGISITRSSSIIGGFIVLFECGIINTFEGVSKLSLVEGIWKSKINFIIYIILLVIPALVINNKLLFNNDKYLSYFDSFDKMENNNKNSYYLLSFISVFIIISFFIFSFLLL